LRRGSRVLTAETRERLRALIREIETRPVASVSRERPHEVADDIERVGAYAWETEEKPPDGYRQGGWTRRETAVGWCSERVRWYALDEDCGWQPLTELRLASADVLGLLAPNEQLETAGLEDLLFLDIETTGLSGAGACVFLVAIAAVRGDRLELRQYLAGSPAEEGALVEALLTDSGLTEGRRPVLVTYNGRGFDAPMLDARATMHRRRAGFDALPHLDLLPVARTLYRGTLQSLRLKYVESSIVGVTRPSADVDGAEVPAWYFRFLRSGDLRFIDPIASHNLIDVYSLAGLLARVAAVVRGRREPTAGERVGLARLLRVSGDRAGATRELCAALDELPPGLLRCRALGELGDLAKRSGDFALAERLWSELAATQSSEAVSAAIELAKYYEHRARDHAQAAVIAWSAYHRAERANATPRTLEAIAHRLRRLESRIGSAISL